MTASGRYVRKNSPSFLGRMKVIPFSQGERGGSVLRSHRQPQLTIDVLVFVVTPFAKLSSFYLDTLNFHVPSPDYFPYSEIMENYSGSYPLVRIGSLSNLRAKISVGSSRRRKPFFFHAERMQCLARPTLALREREWLYLNLLALPCAILHLLSSPSLLPIVRLPPIIYPYNPYSVYLDINHHHACPRYETAPSARRIGYYRYRPGCDYYYYRH